MAIHTEKPICTDSQKSFSFGFALPKSMKVIGITGKTYLVEMTAGELESLTGIGRGWGDASLTNIGPELEIQGAWGTIRSLQSKQKELPQLANKLRALADLLEPIAVEIPVIQETKTA